MKFKVGDRIMGTCVDAGGVNLRGMAGVVVTLNNFVIAVEFDKSFLGEHDCDRGLKHGRWCRPSVLSREDKTIDKVGMDLSDMQKIINKYVHDYRDQKISEEELSIILNQFAEDVITSFLCDFKVETEVTK